MSQCKDEPNHSHHHSHHHDHQQHHHHHHYNSASPLSGLIFAFSLNAGFCVVEAIGGYFASSQAIMADALHDFGDSLSLLLLIALKWYSAKPAASQFSFGYRRLNLIGATVVGGGLVIGSFVILSQSLPKLLNPTPVNSPLMIGLSILGVFVNGLAVYRLRLSYAQPHNPPHSQFSSSSQNSGVSSANFSEKLVSLHLLEDLWGWVIVLIGAIMIQFFSWFWIDPLLSIFLAFFILWRTYSHLSDVGRLFLLGASSQFSNEKIRERILSVEGVLDCHHLHIWELDFGYHIITSHLVLKNAVDVVKVKQLVRQKLTEVGPCEVTLEMEFEGEQCLDPEHLSKV